MVFFFDILTKAENHFFLSPSSSMSFILRNQQSLKTFFFPPLLRLYSGDEKSIIERRWSANIARSKKEKSFHQPNLLLLLPRRWRRRRNGKKHFFSLNFLFSIRMIGKCYCWSFQSSLLGNRCSENNRDSIPLKNNNQTIFRGEKHRRIRENMITKNENSTKGKEGNILKK